MLEVIGIDGRSLEGDQRRGAVVNKETKTVKLYENASLKPASAPKGIPTSQILNFHLSDPFS